MTDMIITEDGVRINPADAKALGVATDRTIKVDDHADRERTTTAVGRAFVKDDAAGTVITSAADPSGADDGKTPAGTNLGLGDVDPTVTGTARGGARPSKGK